MGVSVDTGKKQQIKFKVEGFTVSEFGETYVDSRIKPTDIVLWTWTDGDAPFGLTTICGVGEFYIVVPFIFYMPADAAKINFVVIDGDNVNN
jgi:hypothetical protein